MSDSSKREAASEIRKVIEEWALLRDVGPRFKSLESPAADYGFAQDDEVRDVSGELVGISNCYGYSHSEGEVISLATLNLEAAAAGTQVEIFWREPAGNRGCSVSNSTHEQRCARLSRPRSAPALFAS